MLKYGTTNSATVRQYGFLVLKKFFSTHIAQQPVPLPLLLNI